MWYRISIFFSSQTFKERDSTRHLLSWEQIFSITVSHSLAHIHPKVSISSSLTVFSKIKKSLTAVAAATLHCRSCALCKTKLFWQFFCYVVFHPSCWGSKASSVRRKWVNELFVSYFSQGTAHGPKDELGKEQVSVKNPTCVTYGIEDALQCYT